MCYISSQTEGRDDDIILKPTPSGLKECMAWTPCSRLKNICDATAAPGDHCLALADWWNFRKHRRGDLARGVAGTSVLRRSLHKFLSFCVRSPAARWYNNPRREPSDSTSSGATLSAAACWLRRKPILRWGRCVSNRAVQVLVVHRCDRKNSPCAFSLHEPFDAFRLSLQSGGPQSSSKSNIIRCAMFHCVSTVPKKSCVMISGRAGTITVGMLGITSLWTTFQLRCG